MIIINQSEYTSFYLILILNFLLKLTTLSYRASNNFSNFVFTGTRLSTEIRYYHSQPKCVQAPANLQEQENAQKVGSLLLLSLEFES